MIIEQIELATLVLLVIYAPTVYLPQDHSVTKYYWIFYAGPIFWGLAQLFNTNFVFTNLRWKYGCKGCKEKECVDSLLCTKECTSIRN